MPYKLLKKMERFNLLRQKQLLDDRRIFVAWFASLSRGKKIKDKEGKAITLAEVIRRYAKVSAILQALGFKLEPSKDRTRHAEILDRVSQRLTRNILRKYEGKVIKVNS